jgi:hypothetical protein
MSRTSRHPCDDSVRSGLEDPGKSAELPKWLLSARILMTQYRPQHPLNASNPGTLPHLSKPG